MNYMDSRGEQLWLTIKDPQDFRKDFAAVQALDENASYVHFTMPNRYCKERFLSDRHEHGLALTLTEFDTHNKLSKNELFQLIVDAFSEGSITDTGRQVNACIEKTIEYQSNRLLFSTYSIDQDDLKVALIIKDPAIFTSQDAWDENYHAMEKDAALLQAILNQFLA